MVCFILNYFNIAEPFWSLPNFNKCCDVTRISNSGRIKNILGEGDAVQLFWVLGAQGLYYEYLHYFSTIYSLNKQFVIKINTWIINENNWLESKSLITITLTSSVFVNFLFQMLTVKLVWSLGCCLTTTVVPISSRRWWAPWRLPRRGRWSTSRASCFCKVSMTMLILSCSKNEAKVWIRWPSTTVGLIWILPKYWASAVFQLVTELLFSSFLHV